MDEVLADAGAGLQQVGDGRADAGRAAAVLERVRDQLDQQPQRRERIGAGAERALQPLGIPLDPRLVLPRQQELAGRLDVGVEASADHGPCGGSGGALVHDAGAHVDRQRLVRRRDAELEHLGAGVVEVARDARLRVDPRVELVAALRRGRRRPHPQRVEVVADRRALSVLGRVADREVHGQTTIAMPRSPAAIPAK